MFIYEIRNVKNNKRYIGQTIQRVEKRWSQHRRELNHNKHRNVHLQNAWNKYGEESFQFTVLESCNDKFYLNTREIELVDVVIKENGYNLVRGGHCESPTTGKKYVRSNEIRDKYARIAKPNGYPILISPIGEEVQVINVKRFAREQNLTFSGVQGLMNGGCSYFKGWSIKGRPLLSHNENISRGRRPNGFPNVVSPIGEVYKIEPTLTKFCKEHKLSPGCLSQLINGRKSSYKNWTVQI